MTNQERLIERISSLPPTKLSAVAEFVESLDSRPTPEEEQRLVAEYAAEFAGTEFDLDPALEDAGLECLQKIYEGEKG